MLTKELKQVDILCIIEHWLEEHEIDYFNFPNFSLHSKFSRKTMKHGGTCIYVKNNIEAKNCTKFENINMEKHFEASIVELPKHRTFIICLYRSPNSNIKISIEKLEFTVNDLNKKNKNLVIIGDLNIDFSNGKTNIQLEAMLNSFGLQAVVSPNKINK